MAQFDEKSLFLSVLFSLLVIIFPVAGEEEGSGGAQGKTAQNTPGHNAGGFGVKLTADPWTGGKSDAPHK